MREKFLIEVICDILRNGPVSTGEFIDLLGVKDKTMLWGLLRPFVDSSMLVQYKCAENKEWSMSAEAISFVDSL